MITVDHGLYESDHGVTIDDERFSRFYFFKLDISYIDMPPPNKIWTLNDVAKGNGHHGSNGYPEGVDAASLPTSGDGKAPSFLKYCHILSLPNAEQAKTLLARVVREFEPIVKQRGYNVLSVSELCCCNDGLDFDPTADGKKRRKRRKMSNNIWGYNQTTSSGNRKSHTVHLRLRHTSNHHSKFLPYEDVAGTLAHELAHCEHGPHDAKFYKLMDEILDQHAGLMASNFSGASVPSFAGNGASIPSFTGAGHALGGNRDMAGARKQQQQQARPGYKLGGDNQFTQWMTPAEAAVAAAEARRRQQQLRLRGDHCCRPCTITIDDSEEEGEEDSGKEGKPAAKPFGQSRSIPSNDDNKKRSSDSAQARAIDVENLRPAVAKKPKAKVPAVASLPTSGCIDLTIDSSDDETVGRPKKAGVSRPSQQTQGQWACTKCTFLNLPLTLACSICQAERDLRTR